MELCMVTLGLNSQEQIQIADGQILIKFGIPSFMP